MPIRTDLIDIFYKLNTLCDKYEDTDVRTRLHHVKPDEIKQTKLEINQVRDGCCACSIY
jgi:hypothetical protein